MALKDDPALLRRPLGFAGRVNAAEDADLDDLRERLPGLLKFARTFVAEILEQEFDTPLAGFPIPARARAAALGARLKRERVPADAQRLVMCIVDLCDLEIDRREMSGEDDEEDDDAYREHILDLSGIPAPKASVSMRVGRLFGVTSEGGNSSMSPCASSVWIRFGLPCTCSSGPSCCFVTRRTHAFGR